MAEGAKTLDMGDDVVVLLSVVQRELAGAVVVGLHPLGANHGEGVAEPAKTNPDNKVSKPVM